MSDLMHPDDALAQLLARARPLAERENVTTAQALGRILAQPLSAPVTVPPTDNSAVDGYAIRFADFTPGQPLPASQRIPAGSHPAPLAAGTAARIFTGATVPPGADTVLMQENCQALEKSGQVQILKTPDPGQNIRPAGQDIRQGDPLLAPGTRLLPQHMGLLASVGLAQIAVWRRLKVAILSTGDELVPPGQALKPGQIYNSNRFTLHGLLQALDCEVLDLGDVADTPDATRAALKKAADEADLVISSGGVSVGDEDHVRSAVTALGQLHLWRLAIKPGKPFAHGVIQHTPFMGLPGNPAAVLVTFLLLVRPYIRRCQGVTDSPQADCFPLPLGFSIDQPSNRRDFRRVRHHREGLASWLEEAPNQSSGMLSSACWADGLALIPQHQTLARGELVAYYPFNGLIYG